MVMKGIWNNYLNFKRKLLQRLLTESFSKYDFYEKDIVTEKITAGGIIIGNSFEIDYYKGFLSWKDNHHWNCGNSLKLAIIKIIA